MICIKSNSWTLFQYENRCVTAEIYIVVGYSLFIKLKFRIGIIYLIYNPDKIKTSCFNYGPQVASILFCWTTNLLLRHPCHPLTKKSHLVTIDNFPTFLETSLLHRDLCQSELKPRLPFSFSGAAWGRAPWHDYPTVLRKRKDRKA